MTRGRGFGNSSVEIMARRRTARSADAVSRSTGPPPGALPSGVEGLLQALPLLVFLSGATALVYETLWLRSFGLIFGNTTRAVSLVLATFMTLLVLPALMAVFVETFRLALVHVEEEGSG